MLKKSPLVHFPCKDIMLEGILARSGGQGQDVFSGVPSALDTNNLTAGLICHPHPLYGGNMDNNVVLAVWRAFLESHLTALRFNFRGTGGSQGKHGGGGPEQEDVRAALDYLTTQHRISNKRIVLAGYSFGAVVGLRVAVQDPRVFALIAVAPPLSLDDFSFLEDCPKAKLILAGVSDLFSPATLVENLYRCLKEPKKLTFISETDHFFFGREQELTGNIRDFILSLNPT